MTARHAACRAWLCIRNPLTACSHHIDLSQNGYGGGSGCPVLGGIWWVGEVLPEILGGPPGGSWRRSRSCFWRPQCISLSFSVRRQQKPLPPPTRAFISPAGARSPGPPHPGLGPGRPRPVRVWAGPRRSGNLKMYHAYQIKPIIILKMYHTYPRA